MKKIPLLFVFCLNAELIYSQGFNHNQLMDPDLGLSHSNGVAVADFDLDGYLDMYVVAVGAFKKEDPKTWNRLLKGSPSAQFIDVTINAKLDVQTEKDPGDIENGVKMGASWGDYDNDGYPDLYVTSFGNDHLWHNMGDGTFQNVTETSGIIQCSPCHGMSALWWDYNNDGYLDIYVNDWGGINRFYHNNGDGSFEEIGDRTKLNLSDFSFTSLPLDVNKDGWMDLYIVNDHGLNHLYINNGDSTFSLKTDDYGLYDGGHGMGADICDFGNDGHFDIYLTNIWKLNPNPFFVNTGHGNFEEMAQTVNLGNVGWGWGVRFFDFDNDMDEDVYIVNQNDFGDSFPDYNRFFENVGEKFKSYEKELGVDNYAEARGLEVFDSNKDGNMDMVVANWNAPLSFYHNNTNSSNNWIQIELEGTQSNRNAFGTVLRIKTNKDLQHRLHHGANYLGQSIKPVHFGVGSHQIVDELTLFWPGGKVEKVYDLDVNKFYRFKEGEQEEVFGETYGTDSNVILTGVDDLINPKDNHDEISLVIFPNPVTSRSVLRLNLSKTGNVELKIHDVLGREIHNEYFSTQRVVTDLNWPQHLVSDTGFFYVQIITAKSKIVSKVLKQ